MVVQATTTADNDKATASATAFAGLGVGASVALDITSNAATAGLELVMITSGASPTSSAACLRMVSVLPAQR